MKEKWTPRIIAVMAFVVFIVLGLAWASVPLYADSDANVKYKEVNVWNSNDEYSIRNDPSYYRAGTGFKLITNLELRSDKMRIRIGQYPGLARTVEDKYFILIDNETVNELYPLFTVRYTKLKPPTIVYVSVHPKDPSNPKKNLYFRLDRIDGLMSLEEAQMIVTEKETAEAKKAAEATEKATQEKERQAQQEQTSKAEQ